MLSPQLAVDLEARCSKFLLRRLFIQVNISGMNMALWGRAQDFHGNKTPEWQQKQSNQPPPRQDDRKTRKGTKQCTPKQRFNTELLQIMGGTHNNNSTTTEQPPQKGHQPKPPGAQMHHRHHYPDRDPVTANSQKVPGPHWSLPTNTTHHTEKQSNQINTQWRNK